MRLKLLQDLVNADLAPAFEGSPKLFIVEACRGEDEIMEIEKDG